MCILLFLDPSVLYISIKSNWFDVLFKADVSLLILHRKELVAEFVLKGERGRK